MLTMQPLTPDSTRALSMADQTPTGYPTLKQAWWLIGILFLWQIPVAIPYGLLTYVSTSYNLNLHGLPETLAYVLIFSLTIWIGFRKRGSSRLALAPVSAWAFPVIVIGTLALGLLIEPITSLLPVPEWLDKILKETFTRNMILSAVIFAPILEEILLRGIILDGLLKRYSPTKAIVWSAIIFGVMHLNPVQAVGAFILGIALGWLYYRTRSLWPCIFLHFVNNGIGSLALFFDENLDMSRNYTRTWLGNDALYAGLLVGCALLCYVAYRLLNQLLPVRAAVSEDQSFSAGTGVA